MSPMPALLLASRQLVTSAGTVGGRGAPCAVVQPVVALSLPVQSAPTGPIAREAFLQVAQSLCTGRWTGLEWPEPRLQAAAREEDI